MGGFGFKKKNAEEPVKKRTRTIIKCEECEKTFYSDEINLNNAADSCTCKNLKIGIIKPKDSVFLFYVTVTWSISRPKFYDEYLDI